MTRWVQRGSIGDEDDVPGIRLNEIQPDRAELERLQREQGVAEELAGMLVQVLKERRVSIGTPEGGADSYTYGKAGLGRENLYSPEGRSRAAIKLCDALKAALEAEIDRLL